jgi:hypothetical protein
MNLLQKYNILCLLLFTHIIITVIIFSCENKAIEKTEELILVNINDSLTISTNEFIRRAEYTIRPPYCQRDAYIDKKIILNSLIAEKLLAVEAGQDNALSKNDTFQRFIIGRREQAMRQWMYQKQAIEKVKLDSSEFRKYYKYAGREYEVAYYGIKDTVALNQVVKELNFSSSFFERFYIRTYGDTTIPRKIVLWKDLEPFNVLRSLYTDNVYKGKVLEPIEIDKDYYLLIKVQGWNDEKVLSDSQIKERKRKVVDRLKHEKAGEIWNIRVAQIMKGKKVDFNGSVFWMLSDIFAKKYLKSDKELKEVLQISMWHETDTLNLKIGVELDKILDQPFLSIDDKIWTVKDFKNELMSHPLVFRKRKMVSEEFPKQFRLAVVDLIRDFFITQEAYKKGYDNVSSVKREERTWRDAYLAIYQRDTYLESIGELENFGKNYLSVLSKHLNTYVDSLYSKYDKRVWLNIAEFEEINLSNVDLYVQQPFLPYKQAVPRFPVLTTSHYLGYLAEL